MAGRLAGKVAIVTGAASRGPGVGTGKAMSVLFAREGAKVLLVNRSAGRAEALAEEIRAEDRAHDVLAFAADVTAEAEARAMVAAAEAHWGRLDILVNNVGTGNAGNVETVTEADWDRTFAVNLKAGMFAAKAAVPALRRAGGGAILNVSSVVGALGLKSPAGAVAYASSKSALAGLTQSLAADYAGEGIRANCIVVGTVHTPMVAFMGEDGRERRRRAVPLKTEGTGWDVAWAAVYLCSDEARWVTGILLPVDGGLLAIRDWPR